MNMVPGSSPLKVAGASASCRASRPINFTKLSGEHFFLKDRLLLHANRAQNRAAALRQMLPASNVFHFVENTVPIDSQDTVEPRLRETSIGYWAAVCLDVKSK